MKRKIRNKNGGSNLSAVSVKSFGFEHGSNPQENAKEYMNAQNNKQNALNNTLHNGGSNGIVVPQFAQVGPNVSPQNGNSVSIDANKNLIANQNNAKYDCHATNSCPVTVKGGRRHKKYKRTKRILKKHVQRKKTYRKHKKNI